MSEEPQEQEGQLPPPDIAFTQTIQENGMIEQFCQQNYEDHVEECEMIIADKLRDDEPEPQPQPQQEPQPEPAPEPDPVDEIIGGEHGPDVEIETLVADCVGKGFLGFHKPDTRACMRVVAKHEREMAKR